MTAPARASARASAPRRIDGPLLRQMAVAAFRAWRDDRCASLGASLAYYTLFSLAPLLLIAVSVAGLVFGEEAARGQVAVQLGGLLGPSAAQAVQGLLASTRWPTGSLLATVTGLAVMLFGATTVLAELQDTLDHIWRAPTRRIDGLWAFLRARILSFGVILGVGFLLMVSLLADAALAGVQALWAPWLGDWSLLIDVVSATIGFVLTAALFATLFKWIPRVRIAWSDVVAGALLTAALFTLGRYAIGLYIGHGAVASGYGAAGSVVVLLVWVYYSAQIFLFGAEVTWVLAHTIGSRRHEPAPAGARPAPAGTAALPPGRPEALVR